MKGRIEEGRIGKDACGLLKFLPAGGPTGGE
jgi:hypothetical protein